MSDKNDLINVFNIFLLFIRNYYQLNQQYLLQLKWSKSYICAKNI